MKIFNPFFKGSKVICQRGKKKNKPPTSEKNEADFRWTDISNSRTKPAALMLNEGIPRALKGKKLRLKIPRVLPSIFELFLVFQIWGQNTIGGQYLQNINALIFWFKYLQKINAMPSDFWWKKIQVLLHWWIFFNPFFKGSKAICQRGKNIFFSSEIWGHCIYFLQVLKSEYEGMSLRNINEALKFSITADLPHTINIKLGP